MKVSILTLFPDMVSEGLNTSIIGRAAKKGLISINAVNIRDYTTEKHGKVDDYIYGGGAGMLMQAQPVYDAWESVAGTKENRTDKKIRTVYVTPQGTPFSQKIAEDLAREEELIILCGHYEGIDERVLEETVTDYISIGDYVLTGGELAAMVIVDAVSRLVPGVLGNEISADTESFHGNLLEYPQYSRPEVWHEKSVPEVLLSGNHDKINEWRLEQACNRTKERRPDLFAKYEQTEKVIKRLRKKKRDYIHLIETLTRGTGEILYEQDMDILVYNASCKLAILTVSSLEKGLKLLELIPKDMVSIEISQEFMIDPLIDRYGMHVDMECKNALYTCKEALPVKHKDIRLLDERQLEYILANYHCGNREYIADRLRKGAIYGLYLGEELAGFVGEHEEGSVGLLFVDERFRRRQVGESLEAFMINKHRSMGYLPFGQIVDDNLASMALQEKCGLYLSQASVWWMSIGDKWQG